MMLESRVFQPHQSPVRPKSALNFVEEEEKIVLVAEATKPAKEFLRGDMNSPLALNRLHHDRHRLGANGGRNGIQIPKGQMHKSFQKRCESFLDLLLRRGGNPGHGASVKGILEGEDLVATGWIAEFARQLDQPFVGLRATIAEENFAAPSEFNEAAGKFGLRGGAIEI